MPVGDDQLPMIEQTNEIVHKMNSLLPAPVLRRLEDRRRHSEARAAMTGSGIRRFRLIVNELLCGRYFRYGRGWLNVVQDLLLRT